MDKEKILNKVIKDQIELNEMLLDFIKQFGNSPAPISDEADEVVLDENVPNFIVKPEDSYSGHQSES